jgi:hypothetical protein
MRTNRNIRFNLVGGGTLYIPPRNIGDFYKDFMSGHNIVEVNGERFEVRDSRREIQDQMSKS